MQSILALDIGLKRIGLAKSIQNIPLPLPPILRKNRNQAAKEVSRVISDSNAEILVVGIPKEGECAAEMERRIRHFVSLLEIPKRLEVHFVDESFSSFEALQKMQRSKKSKKKDGTLDSLAAMVILERFLMCQKQN